MAPGLTYAIPDLHGRLDLLTSALAKIVAHAGGRAATVVTLGDYIDRGPDSCGVIDHLMAWQSSNLPLLALKGNHEEMMWRTCTELPDPGWWIANGGDRTLLSYGQPPDQPPNLLVVPPSRLDCRAAPASCRSISGVRTRGGGSCVPVGSAGPQNIAMDAVSRRFR